MGIETHAARFIVECKIRGVDFDRTLTIGRQTLNIDPLRLKRQLGRKGTGVSDDEVKRILSEADGFAEPLFRWGGASRVESMDASDYEKATILHDMNRPIDGALQNQFTAVFDGGSLEHVFNFPVAIRNCMEMVSVGGHLLIVTPANNYFGHGFYQFSPELFYRVLSEENGFEVARMTCFGSDPESPWYEVKDPRAVGKRVTLFNSVPTSLAICARRTRLAPIFSDPPQQSDYSAEWTRSDVRSSPYSGGPSRSRLRSRIIPRFLRRWIVRWRGMTAKPDPECFVRIDD